MDQLVNGKGYSLPDGSFTIYLHKSDACTGEQEDTAMGRPSKAGKGDGYGGLGGSLGGRVWRFVTLPEHAAVPIAVREFAAFIVEITYEGDGIADGEDVLHIAEVDALATVDTLTTNAASSPAMQALHRFLLNHPVYRRRAARLLLAHCFGVANFISDAASRGLWELVARLCRQLDMAMERHAAPPIAAEVMDLALRLRGAGDAGSEGSTSGRATSEPIRRRVVLSTWRTRHPHKLGIRPPSGAGASAEVRCNKVLFCKAIDCYGSAIVQLGYDVEVDDKVSDGHIVKALNNWVTGVEGFYGGYLLDTEVDLLIGAIVARLHRRSHEIHAIVVRSEYQKTPARYGTRLMNELMAPLEPGTDMRIVNKSCMRTAQPFLAKYGFKFGSKATKWEDAHGVYTVPIPPQTAQAFSIDSSEDEVEVEVEDSPEPAATSAFSGGVPLVPCATPLLSSALVGGKQPMDSHAPPPPSSPQCRHSYSNQWLECPACDCPRNICDRCDHIESCFNCEYALDLETDVRLQGWRQLHPDSEEAKHLRERSPHVCKDGTTGRWARCNNGCPAQFCSRCLEWRQPPLGLPCVCASRHDRPAELPYVTPNPEVDAASHDSTSTNLGLAADPVSHSDFSMAKVPHESAGDMGVDNMPFTLRVLPQLYLRQSHVRVMVQVLAEWWAFWRRICAFAHWAAALPQHCPLAAKRPRTCRCTNAHASGRTCTNVATHEDLCEGCTYASLLPSGQEICGCNCNACRLRGGAPARYQISKRAGPEPPPDWLTIFEPILLWARESAGFHGREHWNGHGQEECLRHMYYRPPPHKRDEYHRTLLHLILTLSGTCRTGRQDPVIRMYWPRESRYLERQHMAVRLTLEVSLDHLTRDWAQIIESLAHGLLVIPIRLRVLADYYSKRTLLHCVLNLSATCRRYRALPFLQQLLATERPEMEAHELFAEVERQQALLRQQQLEHQLRIETERESRRQLRISDAWERNKCDFPNWLAFQLRAHIEDVQWLLQGAFYRYVCWCINHSTVGDGGLNRDKDVAKDVVRRLYGVHSMPNACVRTDAGLETVRIPRPGDGLLAQAEYLLRWDWRAVFYFVAAIYNLEFTATAHRNMHRVRDQFDYLLYVPAAEINFALSGRTNAQNIGRRYYGAWGDRAPPADWLLGYRQVLRLRSGHLRHVPVMTCLRLRSGGNGAASPEEVLAHSRALLLRVLHYTGRWVTEEVLELILSHRTQIMKIERNRARYQRRDAYNKFVDRFLSAPPRYLPQDVYEGPGFDPFSDEVFQHNRGRHMDWFMSGLVKREPRPKCLRLRSGGDSPQHGDPGGPNLYGHWRYNTVAHEYVEFDFAAWRTLHRELLGACIRRYDRRRAIRVIQSWVRKRRYARQERDWLVCESACTLQLAWLTYRGRQREMRHRRDAAARCIQIARLQWRERLRRKRRAAAIRIQRLARLWLDRLHVVPEVVFVVLHERALRMRGAGDMGPPEKPKAVAVPQPVCSYSSATTPSATTPPRNRPTTVQGVALPQPKRSLLLPRLPPQSVAPVRIPASPAFGTAAPANFEAVGPKPPAVGSRAASSSSSAPHLDSRAGAVYDMLAEDTSNYSIKSGNLWSICEQVFDPSSGVKVRSAKGQRSAWKHWEAWCRQNNTSPWRFGAYNPDSYRDSMREQVLQAGFIRFCHLRQSVHARGVRKGKAAQPKSAVKVLSHIRRMHRDRGETMAPAVLVASELRKLNFEYKNEFGVQGLIPERKQPFTREILTDCLLGAPKGFKAGIMVVDWEARSGRTLRAITTVAASTGFRKAEFTMDAGGNVHDCLCYGHVTWYLRGHTFGPGQDPPREYLLNPQEGDFLVLQPPPSKSDPFDAVWGSRPIWLPYRPKETLNAFAAVLDLWLHHAPPTDERERTPLFQREDKQAYTGAQLDTVLSALLLRKLSPDVAKLYSWHSARIFLATALLAAGCTRPQIQAMCRWQTEESLEIYCLMDAKLYAELIDQAMSTRFRAARANHLAKGIPFLSKEDMLRATCAAPTRGFDASAADIDADPDPDDDADDDVAEPLA